MPSFRTYVEKKIRDLESCLALPSEETDWELIMPYCRRVLADVQKKATIEGVPGAIAACRLSGKTNIQDVRCMLAECLEACPSEQEITPVLLKVKQAAALYNIGERTLYRLLKSGELRNCGHGGSKRIKPADLERYLEYQDQPQAAPESLFD